MENRGKRIPIVPNGPTETEKTYTGKECVKCLRIITDDDVERRNWGIKVRDIPGVMHRKCRGDLTAELMDRPVSTESLEGEKKNIIGE